jgi:uncharacterized protein YhfF
MVHFGATEPCRLLEHQMNKKSKAEAFWQTYLDSLPLQVALPSTTYEVWSFGHTAELADELGDLTRRGVKTATTGLLWEYEAEDENLPRPGDLSIITNADGDPLCIIETSEVEIRPFNEVDEQFAFDEGEGDRSLAYWKQVHWNVFSMVCLALGREASETMPVVCERFRVVFAKQ